jgi:hypothetical protein
LVDITVFPVLQAYPDFGFQVSQFRHSKDKIFQDMMGFFVSQIQGRFKTFPE